MNLTNDSDKIPSQEWWMMGRVYADATEDPVSAAETTLRSHLTALRLAESLGCELADENTPPAPDSALAAIQELAAQYDAGRLSWGDCLIAAQEAIDSRRTDLE
jgi:hypothetical protein